MRRNYVCQFHISLGIDNADIGVKAQYFVTMFLLNVGCEMGNMIVVQDVLGMCCKIKSLSIISASYCMSQKTEKPILSGQRIKTRKRGEFITVLLSLLLHRAF
jgi:hypothetical protein